MTGDRLASANVWHTLHRRQPQRIVVVMGHQREGNDSQYMRQRPRVLRGKFGLEQVKRRVGCTLDLQVGQAIHNRSGARQFRSNRR